MPRGQSFEPFFQRLIDHPEKALRELRDDPEAFERSLVDEEQGRLAADAVIPAYQAIGAMLFDRDGARVDAESPAWIADVRSFDALKAPEAGRVFIIGGDPGAPHAVWAPAAQARDWNLPASIHAITADHPEGRLVLAAGGVAGDGPLDTACRSFDLTDLERRVVHAVVRTGSGRHAAARLGIAYATVRAVLARVQARIGAPNLPALVALVVAAAFGILPAERDGRAILADMLPLTTRQATIAALVTAGLAREEIAAAVGVSLPVVKKELETIFVALGVSSSAELARLVVEVRALRLFARSTDSAVGFHDPGLEPTRFIPRAGGGGTIAWSDYGPRSAPPVLVVHSNWSARSVPRPLVAALHRAGYRPIAIDRPGFGATSVGTSTIDDPFSQAIADTLQVLDLVGAGRVPIIARCGAQFVMALKAAAPERLGRVVLVSPTPQTSDTGLRKGIVGVVKEAFYRSPRLIEFFFRTIGAQMSLPRIETLTRAIVEGSPTDEALCDDPSFLRDRLRAVRPLSTGNLVGAIHEEHVISRGSYGFAPIDSRDWTVLQGQQDTHNSVDEVTGYWSTMLADARFIEIADGGRFMTSSHPGLVVDCLEGP